MEAVAYNSGLLALCDGSVSFASDSVYCTLHGSGYTPDVAHTTRNNLTAEVSDNDYAPANVGGKSVQFSGGAVVYDSSDISFGDEVSIGGVRYAVFAVGNAASPGSSDPLLWYVDFGQEVSSTDAQFILRTSNGIYEIRPVG